MCQEFLIILKYFLCSPSVAGWGKVERVWGWRGLVV